jgi:hypothetical protein
MVGTGFKVGICCQTDERSDGGNGNQSWGAVSVKCTNGTDEIDKRGGRKLKG